MWTVQVKSKNKLVGGWIMTQNWISQVAYSLGSL